MIQEDALNNLMGIKSQEPGICRISIKCMLVILFCGKYVINIFNEIIGVVFMYVLSSYMRPKVCEATFRVRLFLY